MPTIEVFLMFDPSDRNTMTRRKVTTTERGPDWTWIASHVAKSGYTLKVHGSSVHPSGHSRRVRAAARVPMISDSRLTPQ